MFSPQEYSIRNDCIGNGSCHTLYYFLFAVSKFPSLGPFGCYWILVLCIPSMNRWRFVFQWQEIKSTGLIFLPVDGLLSLWIKKYWFLICHCLKLGIKFQELFPCDSNTSWTDCSSPELFKLCHFLVPSTQLNHFVPIFVSKTLISLNTRKECQWQGCVYLCKFIESQKDLGWEGP